MTRPSAPPARGLVVATLLGALSMLQCSVPEVHGAPADPPGRDGGRKDAAPLLKGEKVESYGAELIGLTPRQLEASHGSPSEKHGSRWTYLPQQRGCSDRIMSEVFTFKNGRVVKLKLEPRQTGKVCGFEQRRSR